jgi:hypothetical protein
MWLRKCRLHIFELLHRAKIPVAVIYDKTHAEWAWEIEHSGGLALHGGLYYVRVILSEMKDHLNIKMILHNYDVV